MMRNITQRIQNCIVESTKQPISKGMLSFLKVVLLRHPSMAQYNQKSFAQISLRVLDFTFEQILDYQEYNEDVLYSVDVYARLMQSLKSKHDSLILETLLAISLDQISFGSNHDHLLPIKSLKYASSHRNDLIGFLWTVYDATLNLATPGTFIKDFNTVFKEPLSIFLYFLMRWKNLYHYKLMRSQSFH